MRSKQLQLELIQDQLAIQERDYKSVAKELKLAIDPVAINRHQDRLANLQEEIDVLEEKEKKLQQELARDIVQQSLSELKFLLQSHHDQFYAICSAYISVLKYRSRRLKDEPKTPDDIINQLVQIPQGQSSHEALEEFVAHLIYGVQSSELISALQHWGRRRLGDDWDVLLHHLERRQVEQTQQGQPALLILISRNDEASTQSQSEAHYQVKAWLIPDVQHYKAYRQGINPIGISGRTGDETYSLESLDLELPKLISQCLTESSQPFDKDSELHICVPVELMNHAVDRWRLIDNYGAVQLPLGREYKVVLRCTDRLSRSYRQAKQWKLKWERHQSLLTRTAHEVFMPGDDSDLEDLYYDLSEADETIVGLKVVQVPSCAVENNLFGVLLQTGTPLAIWCREQLANETHETELDRVLNACCLENLPQTIKKERRNARKQPENAHIGHHLSLLWDDPDLVPPKSA